MHFVRACARILSLAIFLPLAGFAAAAPLQPPTQAAAAFRAVAFQPLPKPAYIEVQPLDDSPDNVRLAWEVHNALRSKGLLAKTGPTLRLTLETDSAPLIGGAPAEGGGNWSAPPEPKLLGFLRAELTDARSGARLWEAEGVYEAIWGDLAGGALKLVPTLVNALGRTVNDESITLR